MGTLTADQQRLPEYCAHKLPTSCRLSSIPECCACADERAHAAAYSTYIDGIGYVLRGNRWQRYCWFCKEFWEARVRASGLRSGQTRIPEVPDQTQFLERWYDFHRGYRTVRTEAGLEERVAVMGEDLRNVNPGCLPRTLDELRAGGERSSLEDETPRRESVTTERAAQGPTLDDTLEQMLQAAEEEQQNPTVDPPQALVPARNGSNNVHAQALVAARSRDREYQLRRVAALRRELHRMRNGIERVISGLRDLGESVPDHAEATGRLTNLGRTLDDISGIPSREDADLVVRGVNDLTHAVNASQTDRTMANLQARVDEAQEHLNEAHRMRRQASAEMEAAEQEVRTSQQRVQQLQREQRTAENYLRLFGTREEMIAQGDSYESPIGGMFNRAWERFSAAEEVRMEERTLREVLANEALSGGEAQVTRLSELQGFERDVWGVPRPRRMPEVEPVRGLIHQDTSNTTHLMEMARDEVFAGQGPIGARGDETPIVDREAELIDFDEGDEEERVMQEYYHALRRQGWGQQRSERGTGLNSDTVPESMSRHAVPDDRARSQHTTARESANDHRPAVESPTIWAQEIVEELAGEQEDTYSRVYELTSQNWLCDVRFLLAKVANSDNYSALHMLSGFYPANAEEFLAELEEPANLPPHPETIYSGLNAMLSSDDLVWMTGLPADRQRRACESGSPLHISASSNADGREERRQNVEAMAEAFQASAEVRRKSALRAPEQLRMLYRLQRGSRDADDRRILCMMLQTPVAVACARRVLFEHRNGPTRARAARLSEVEGHRRQLAREGDNSRQELDAQRRSTHALAVAAGRTAMQTGPRGVMERMAELNREISQDNVTSNSGTAYLSDIPAFDRSVFERTFNHAYPRPHGIPLADFVSSPSESDGEESDDAVGLDARDSGRPEAKTDEDMTVKLECRVCYSQLADIACLPCGHLVMCEWCSNQHSPTLRHDRTRPRRAAGCPVCRKTIRQKVRVFR